ncbi:cytochrome c oxidase subunit 3 family protein [Mycolicibacterium aichiense]|uniref:Probable cytochrome c oxidase subunit 3 n=1 Tax=Mycolicibacterium aichiense TaxID=1799 RepID=A0AAD1HP52_9MYCO|nr:cytochrome c oxidase subunit 3 family protein [Mycolicibacterium aichiense]MCV7020402.1 cytochrome c oxidase subunit 3 family protein [Mycolicibacterium aichiense]BBX07913.1 cytochrome c oxidase subunit III [Mycolicibacterium aichiense]STZ81723.1 cytochrome c oxidase subunit III [Mycolicibacterium aichiense]
MTEVAEGHPDDLNESRPDQHARAHIPGDPSMWFFVIGDLLIFGIYFVGYVYYRGQNPDLFLQSQARLNVDLGAINTVVLLTSSLFVVLGTMAARAGNSADALRRFIVALVLGAVFPILKMVEWIPEITAGITPGTNLFFMFYFVMTGLHLCHVLLGLIILCFVIRNLRVSRPPKISFVETGATYWHMVDVLWLILFAAFYLMR